MADPTAIVRSIETFEQDPNNANNTVMVLKVGVLNMGPTGEIDLEISFASTLSKNQIKSAVNAAIIAAFAARGATLTTQRILTLSDIAG